MVNIVSSMEYFHVSLISLSSLFKLTSVTCILTLEHLPQLVDEVDKQKTRADNLKANIAKKKAYMTF